MKIIVSVPVLGIIFLSDPKFLEDEDNKEFCFRPRTGDYFFIATVIDLLKKNGIEFPSPYWGLFFYHDGIVNIKISEYLVSVPVLGIIFLSNCVSVMKAGFDYASFRPRTGDYFFIAQQEETEDIPF